MPTLVADEVLPVSDRRGAAVVPTLAARLPDSPGRLLLSECCAPDSVFAPLVADMAGKRKVDPRALSVRTLLHLPRVASARGEVTLAQVDRELFHSARILRQDSNTARNLISAGHSELQDLVFGPIDAAAAEAIFSSMHYLKSGRPNSLNFALVDPADGLPVTLCSVSPLEWKRIGNQLQSRFAIPPGRTWDISRVYSRNAAPPNAISFLLSRVRSTLRRSGQGIDLLMTVVDPNLGFSGSSYRAANWQQWFSVKPRPYLYHERRYATPRQLRQTFGTSNLAELQDKFPAHRFEQSRVRLSESMIFCCRLTGETEAVTPHRLHR